MDQIWIKNNYIRFLDPWSRFLAKIWIFGHFLAEKMAKKAQKSPFFGLFKNTGIIANINCWLAYSLNNLNYIKILFLRTEVANLKRD